MNLSLSLPPDLFLFAKDLRQIVKNDNPIVRSLALARGLSYGLRVKTLAGMAACSETHVRRMLRLLKLPSHVIVAISAGAPYTPLIRSLRSSEPMPKVQLTDNLLTLAGS